MSSLVLYLWGDLNRLWKRLTVGIPMAVVWLKPERVLSLPSHTGGEQRMVMSSIRGWQEWAGKGTCLWWRDVLVKLVLMKEPRAWVYFLPSEMLSLSAFSLSPCCHETFWGLSVREAEQGISVHPSGWALAGTGQLISCVVQEWFWQQSLLLFSQQQIYLVDCSWEGAPHARAAPAT